MGYAFSQLSDEPNQDKKLKLDCYISYFIDLSLVWRDRKIFILALVHGVWTSLHLVNTAKYLCAAFPLSLLISIIFIS